MKLIPGNIRDYYDLMIAKYGFSEEGNFFLRTNEKQYLEFTSIKEGNVYKTIEKNNHLLKFLAENYIHQIKYNNSKIRYNYSTIQILFCGKLYSAIRIIIKLDDQYPDSKEEIFYSFDDLQKFCKKNNIKLKIAKECSTYFTWDNKLPFWCIENLTKYFEIKDYTSLCIENKIIIATHDSASYIVKKAKYEIILNGELQQFKFFKVMDAFTAYQELSMFVDGQIAYPGNTVTTIEDKYRIAAHGFDTKYGFRTRPKKL